MALTNNNRLLHASSLKPLLSFIGVPDKYLPKRRIGDRSADGAAFILQDESKVGKFILCKTKNQYMKAEREFFIGRSMGETGIGPKVYDYYSLTLDGIITKNKTRKLSNENLIKVDNIMMNAFYNKNGVNRRIFSQPPVDFNGGIMYIIMENLSYGAKRMETLFEYFRRKKNEIKNWDNFINFKNRTRYNVNQTLTQKMKNMGVLHGDLHSNNVIVKTLANGSVRFYAIDYGRSLLFNSYDNLSKMRVTGVPRNHPLNSKFIG